jgi:uncharacterized membrane protein
MGGQAMRIARLVCLCLWLLSLLTLIPAGLVLAQEEEVEEEVIKLEATYRKLEDSYPGISFEYEVSLSYTGPEYGFSREFDLAVKAPPDWSTYITPQYGDQRLLSIPLKANVGSSKIKVYATPPTYTIPEAGEYSITLEATSGEVNGSVELLAVITATYAFRLTPVTDLYSTSATSGTDNFYSILIQNTGSDTLENIKFSSIKPEGWSIEFSPEQIDELSAGSLQTVDVNIKPAAKTIAGDYQITLAADTSRVTESFKVRVNVKSPDIWGWVAVGIILVVIAGVVFIFMRFSRR